jgi:HK97 family phage major capsid protein
MGLLSLPQCPTYRTSVFCSLELLQDSGIALDAWLAARFAVRFGRAFGAQLASTLIANSPVVVSATGSAASAQSGISGAIGSDDLYRLVATLEPSYFLKSSWAMSFTTYAGIMSLRSTSTGNLIFHKDWDDSGNPLLLQRRVALSPSLPNNIVILGDLRRLIARQAGALLITVSNQKRPESGQLYIRGMFRLQAAAAIDSRTSPIDAPFVAMSTSGTLAAEGKSSPAKPETEPHHQAEGGGSHGTKSSRR